MGGGWVVGGCLNVNLVIGFGPSLGLALWPRAKPINTLTDTHTDRDLDIMATAARRAAAVKILRLLTLTATAQLTPIFVCISDQAKFQINQTAPDIAFWPQDCCMPSFGAELRQVLFLHVGKSCALENSMSPGSLSIVSVETVK